MQREIKTFVVASNNQGKVAEISRHADNYGLTVISPQDLVQSHKLGTQELSSATVPDIEENGETYAENAELKARGFWSWCLVPALADDTGLEIDALDGAPGLYSARYAGEKCDAAANRKKLLKALTGVSNRAARFRCVLCFVFGNRVDDFKIYEAVLEGSISEQEEGSGGFGYDSIFKVAGLDKTLATLKETNYPVKTHRILALESFLSDISAPSV